MTTATERRVVALVDFEWARPGPRDLEPFLRSVDWSGQAPGVDPARRAGADLHPAPADHPVHLPPRFTASAGHLERLLP